MPQPTLRQKTGLTWIRYLNLVAIAALTAATTVSAAAESPVCLRTGFVDVQRPAVEVPAVQFGNGAVPFGIVAHFDESKASGLPGVAVGDDADPIDGPIGFKHGANCVFGSPEAEISYKNIFHFTFFLKLQSSESGQDRTRAVGPDYRKMPKSVDCQTTLLL